MSSAEILGVSAVVISIVSILVAQWRISNADAKTLEKRITKLENETKFTAEDKKCLVDATVKIGLIWSCIEKDFPKLLKQEITPHIDRLLERVSTSGFSSLSVREMKEFDTFLEKEYDNLVTHREEKMETDVSLTRAVVLLFVKAGLDYHKANLGISCESKTVF